MDSVSRDYMTEQEVNAYVGDNAEYYKEKWKAHPETEYYKGWNWSSFFFFLEWAFYRKLYKEAILLYLGLFFLAFVSALILPNFDFLGDFIGQIIRLVLGAFANGIYRKKALRVVLQAVDMQEDDRLTYLKSKGGTSSISVVICIVIEVVLVFLPFFIMLFI